MGNKYIYIYIKEKGKKKKKGKRKIRNEAARFERFVYLVSPPFTSFRGNNGESRNNELPFSRTLHQAETNGRQNNETGHAGWPLRR